MTKVRNECVCVRKVYHLMERPRENQNEEMAKAKCMLASRRYRKSSKQERLQECSFHQVVRDGRKQEKEKQTYQSDMRIEDMM